MSENEFTRFDPTPEERETLKRIHGAYDDATALRQLREFPLKYGYKRYYTDHTGRFFEDVSPEEQEAARNDPLLQEFNKIVQEEINREMLRELGFKF
jgi:hypothetical protein